jgi:hypothetical protein
VEDAKEKRRGCIFGLSANIFEDRFKMLLLMHGSLMQLMG